MSDKAIEKSDDLALDEMMEQRMHDNFGDSAAPLVDFSDKRLDEMNKKLPSWNLEPPYSYLNKK